MKTVILSDIHMGKFWKSNNSAFSRARKLIQNFKYNLNIIRDKFSPNEDVDLIIAGDVYDTVNMNTESLIYIKQSIFESLQRYRKVYIIAGNHESFIDRDGNQQTLLDICISNNSLIYKHNFHKVIISGINYIFIPYQQDIDKQFEAIVENQDKLFESLMPNIIVSHMTPKEIFSFEKFKINDFIDKIKANIKAIMLGHYHIYKEYKYKDVDVISIGNTYYLTLDDIREYDVIDKYYFIIDDIGNIKKVPLMLPEVYEFYTKDQIDFENNTSKVILHNINKEDIIFLRSDALIDYSKITMEGYDVYFELLEDPDETLDLLQETSITNLTSDSNDHNTLSGCWNRYTHGLMGYSEQELNLANWLFNKRNDEDINADNILKQLKTIKDEQ